MQKRNLYSKHIYKFYKQNGIFVAVNILFYIYFMAEARKCFFGNESKPSYF